MTRRLILSTLTIVALLILVFPPGSPKRALAAGSGPKTINVVPGPVRGQAPLGPHGNGEMDIVIALSLRDQTGLDQTLAQIGDPSSPNYHHFLTLDQANAQFNPTSGEEDAVVSWLQNHGLTVTGTYPNHLLVDVSGSTAQIENLLGTTIDNYKINVHGQSRTVFAPSGPITIPASVSDAVSTVVGLDNVPRFFMASNGTANGQTPYFPQDFANLYDVNPLWSGGYTGSGQKIGITLWTVPPSTTTLSNWALTTHAANPANNLHVIAVDGGTTASESPDQGEAGMDIEYTSGMAPGAQINYYEAQTDTGGNPTGQGLIDALNQAAIAGNMQISSSWGECELSGDSWTASVNNVLASNSATGHNYFFSTGDNGSDCPGYGNPWPDYPASSAYAVAVGGTRMSGTPGSTYPGESAWAYCGTCDGGYPEGSGGGYSRIFSRPVWQTGTGLAASGMRAYPDVSAVADPATGAYVCYGTGGCAQFGGTSLAAPLWAGMTADLNQYLTAQGKSLGFLDPTLYNLANHSQTYAPFHDITAGTNGSYNATAGWDAVTGLGSPDLYNLARDMSGSGAPLGTATATATATASPTATRTPSPTATATSGPAPTNTPTATATATAAPTATGTTQNDPDLVANGGFENGTSPWQTSSSGGHQIVSTLRPHSGSYSAWLCGYSSCNDQIWQSVTLPTSFTNLTLSYWFYGDSNDGTTFWCYDHYYARIETASGAVIATPQQVCNTQVTNDWVQESFNLTSALTPYAGQQVRVFFQGTTAFGKSSDFYVDDVNLLATTGSSSPPAPTATSAPTATATRTPSPTATATSGPAPTNTPVPTATSTPRPTNTPVPTSTPPSSGCPGSGCVQAMLNLLNTDRANNGAAPLALNMAQTNGTGTCVGSLGHSQAMQQSGSIWHTNAAYPQASFPADICITYTMAGENVGEAGYGNELTDLQQLDQLMMGETHSAWYCSVYVNHACNIINPNYHQVGIGIVNVNNQTWLTEDFTN